MRERTVILSLNRERESWYYRVLHAFIQAHGKLTQPGSCLSLLWCYARWGKTGSEKAYSTIRKWGKSALLGTIFALRAALGPIYLHRCLCITLGMNKNNEDISIWKEIHVLAGWVRLPYEFRTKINLTNFARPSLAFKTDPVTRKGWG
jgi:hypothetical protein